MSENDFKTQQEIWKWLVDGGEVQRIGNPEEKVRFVNGDLNDIWSFVYIDEWQKVIPKKTVTLRLYMEGNTAVWLKDGVNTYPITPYKPTNWTKEVEILEDEQDEA